MKNFFAQPYDISATGFYFDTFAEYEAQVATLKNSYGQPVEEFEIQVIDCPDGALFTACGINQSNLEQWFEEVEFLDDQEKLALFYLMDNNVVSGLGDALEKLDDVNIYEGNQRMAAEEQFDALHLERIPTDLRFYIDYDQYAKDLECGGEMTEFSFNGNTYCCTNANSI